MIEILLLFGFLVLVSFAIGGISAAPWLPTKKKQREALVKNLSLENGQVVYDLGCGDGAVLFDLASENPDIKAIGYEISILPYLIGKVRKLLHPKKYKNVKIKYGNFFKKDLGEADVVFIFLLSKCYNRLIEKFKKELKDDSLLAVEAWPLPSIVPYKTVKEENLLPVHFYKGYQVKKQA